MSHKISYNYCGVCGSTPHTQLDEPNRAPVRWWDPDDGWKIGTLCRYCHEDESIGGAKPAPDDYAYEATNGVCDDCNTDKDPIMAL